MTAVERLIDIAAPVDRVWATVTDPAQFARFYAQGGARFECRPGSVMRLSWPADGTFMGQVEEAQEPRRFCYRLAVAPGVVPTPTTSTVVEFTLSRTPSGCRVVVRESGYENIDRDYGSPTELARQADETWAASLSMLARMLTPHAPAASAATR